MLPSMAVAKALCVGVATGASQKITASTAAPGLRPDRGEGGRKSSDGCRSEGAAVRRACTPLDVRVTVLAFAGVSISGASSSGEVSASNGITLPVGFS
jgi:hypothetical protein